MHQDQNKNKHHVPVLIREVLEQLSPLQGEAYLDLTAGYGGHAAEVISHTKAPARATLVDRDEFAISELKNRFENSLEIIHSDFLQAAKQLKAEGKNYDVVLADLGVSSPHLNTAIRGFSIQSNGPLDMRMDNRQELTAADVVNQYDREELIKVLRDYGEEPRASKIADAIIRNRPFKTTHELANTIAGQWPGKSRVHPATRTFQAIRIEVNDELRLLSLALPLWVELLNPGGRIAIISFHSLEDRIVKKFLVNRAGNRFDAELRLLNKKPITASESELVSNPRSRSAKLRAAVKIKRKG